MNADSTDALLTPPFGPGAAASSAEAGSREFPAAQLLRTALVEIIGPHEAAVFHGSQDLSGLVRALEVRYGEQPGRGIAHRLGGACLRRIVNRLGALAGFNEPAFRLLPLQLRLRQGLVALRPLLADFGGKTATLEEQGSRFLWRLPDCPLCAGRSTAEPACHLMQGLLQEALAWLGGGRYFGVRETACRGRGSPDCVFQIDLVPVDL